MKTSSVVLGVLAGAAVGAIVGILFAPDKGYNTRRKITRKGEEFVDDLKERAMDIRNQATDMVDTFADAIHSPKGKVEVKVRSENNKRKVVHTEL